MNKSLLFMELEGSSAHKSLPLVPGQSQINPVHDLLSHFLMTHFDITFPSMPRLSKQFFASSFPGKTLCPTCALPNRIPTDVIILITSQIYSF
jgi:hypothetical protein